MSFRQTKETLVLTFTQPCFQCYLLILNLAWCVSVFYLLTSCYWWYFLHGYSRCWPEWKLLWKMLLLPWWVTPIVVVLLINLCLSLCMLLVRTGFNANRILQSVFTPGYCLNDISVIKAAMRLPGGIRWIITSHLRMLGSCWTNIIPNGYEVLQQACWY